MNRYDRERRKALKESRRKGRKEKIAAANKRYQEQLEARKKADEIACKSHHRHLSVASAESAIERMRKAGNTSHLLNYWRCTVCGYYHVGHSTPTREA